MGRCVYGLVNGYTDGWVDVWMGASVNGYMDDRWWMGR